MGLFTESGVNLCPYKRGRVLGENDFFGKKLNFFAKFKFFDKTKIFWQNSHFLEKLIFWIKITTHA